MVVSQSDSPADLIYRPEAGREGKRGHKDHMAVLLLHQLWLQPEAGNRNLARMLQIIFDKNDHSHISSPTCFYLIKRWESVPSLLATELVSGDAWMNRMQWNVWCPKLGHRRYPGFCPDLPFLGCLKLQPNRHFERKPKPQREVTCRCPCWTPANISVTCQPQPPDLWGGRHSESSSPVYFQLP